MRDLPRSQMGIDTENNYAPKYITIRGKGPVLQDLKSAAKKLRKSISRPIQTVKGKQSHGI